MTEPSPEEKSKNLWVRLLTDEEIAKNQKDLAEELPPEVLDELWCLRERIRKRIYSHAALPAPPPGSYYLPEGGTFVQPPREEQVERIEERVVVSRGEPKITRIRKRVVPIRSPVSPPPRFAAASTPEPPESQSGLGRPPALDDFARERICTCLQVGLSRSLAAAEVGVHKSTITRTMQRDPEFKQRVLQAEASYEKNRILQLLQAARESWRAGAWLFKHYHPHLSTRRKQRAAESQFAAEAVRQISDAVEDATDAPRKAG